MQLAIRGGTPEIEPASLPIWPRWDATETTAVLDVLGSGHWSRSSYDNAFRHEASDSKGVVDEFESRFCEFTGTKHGVAVCNGTVGLEISLRALNISEGDEVIIPAYTAFATMSAVLSVGAKPVFADVSPRNGNIDPEQIDAKISERTKAMIVVHFGGVPCQMDEISTIAQSRGIALIEDSAHAHGSRWESQHLGGMGDIGVFSFHQSKNLVCGEGGMIVTNDDQLAASARSIHDCGRAQGGKWYQHQRFGTNARMTELQAALGVSQLKRLEDQTLHRQEMVHYFLEQIADIPFLEAPAVPQQTSSCSFHLLLLTIDSERCQGISRHRLIAAANAEGLPCWSGYPRPISHCPFLRNSKTSQDVHVPHAERLCSKSALWIDHFYFLAERNQVRSYANVFKKIEKNLSELCR